MKKKKTLIIPFLIISLVIITGCSINSSGDNKEQRQNTRQETTARQMPNWDENFSEGSINDLEIGQKVSIMGTENADKSVVAERIMIGNSKTDWQKTGRAMGPPPITDQETDNDAGQPQPDFDGQRPNFERFQNMSEEERVKFREEMMAQRETSGMTRPNRAGGSITRLNGEIIDKDDTSIILKLEGGGSKLIFLSENIDISIAKPLDTP